MLKVAWCIVFFTAFKWSFVHGLFICCVSSVTTIRGVYNLLTYIESTVVQCNPRTITSKFVLELSKAWSCTILYVRCGASR